MATKPILDLTDRGKRIRIEFAARQLGISIRYDIFVDDQPVQVDLFAEEVMRWLAGALHEDSPKAPTTKLCSMDDARHCRDTQNADCHFPQCQIRETEHVSARKRRSLRR